MPVVHAATLDGIADTVGVAADAVNFDGASRQGAETPGANGFIDARHRLLFDTLGELQPDVVGIGSGFSQKVGGKAVHLVEHSPEQMLGSDVSVA